MTASASEPWLARLLVFGPPGSGVPLVVGCLERAGMVDVAGWEGGPEGHRAEDASNLSPEASPVLLALEANDATCMERAQPPWSERSLPGETALAVRDLERTRERLFPARLRAHLLLDSSQVSAAVLLARVRQLQAYLSPAAPGTPAVVVESFAFPRGVPLDLGWCVDARALRNPYWEPSLRMLSGLDPRVRDFVLGQELAGKILSATEELVGDLLVELQARSRRALRLAVGCTGGYHRSVVVAEELGRRLSVRGIPARIWHRDLPDRP